MYIFNVFFQRLDVHKFSVASGTGVTVSTNFPVSGDSTILPMDRDGIGVNCPNMPGTSSTLVQKANSFTRTVGFMARS